MKVKCAGYMKAKGFNQSLKTGVYLLLGRSVFYYFRSEIFTFINRKMHTFDLRVLIKGETFRL